MDSTLLHRILSVAATVLACGVAAAAPGFRSVAAAAMQGAVGYERSFGPRDQRTQAAVVVVTAASPATSCYLAPSRYDHSVIGGGYGFGLGAGVAAHGFALQGAGTRFQGDGGYRSWRFIAGLAWSGADGRRTQCSYLHDAVGDAPPADGMITEVSTPLASRPRGHASSVWAGRGGDIEIAAALGATWTAVPALQLWGHVGVAHEAFAAVSGGSASSGGPELLPAFPSDDPATPSSSPRERGLYPTASISLRILFPAARVEPATQTRTRGSATAPDAADAPALEAP